MITPELVSYIENQLKKGKSKEDIISRLIYNGWYREDIDEGFGRVVTPTKPFNENSSFSKPTPKIEEVREEFISNLMSKDTPISPSPSLDKAVDIYKEEIKEDIKKESIDNNITAQKKEDIKEDANKEIKKEEQQQEEEKENNPSLIAKTNDDKSYDPSVPLLDFELLSKLEASIKIKEDNLKKINTDSLSHKDAIISSFSKDSNSKNNISEPIKIKKNISSATKWLVFIIIFIFILSGVYFAFSNGYIKIPSINFKNIPMLGGNPSKILYSSFEKIQNSQSYKNESDIVVKSNGALKMDSLYGEKSFINFPDEIKLHTLGIYDQVSPSLISFDNLSTIESNAWVNKGVVNLKHNGSILYVPINALSKIIELPDVTEGFVAIDDNKINEFMGNITNNNLGGSISFQDILIKGTSTFIYQNMNQISNNAKFSILEKDGGIINDTKVRYFEVIPSDPSLGGLLENIIKGSKVDSFEFWADKDGKIFKYKIVLNVPASYISKESSEFLKIEISSLFYDINGENVINMPDNFIKADEILLKIKDIKNRDKISSFKILADQFYNISNSYGKKPNTLGSCLNPIESSLFSSLGHSDTASGIVKEIRNKMEELVSIFNEDVYCYSTSGTWSISIPIMSSPGVYWCTDNLGETIKTENKISSSICK